MPESTVNPNVQTNVFVAAHDAILPIVVEDLKMAYPNLADNTETNNSAIARVFELINYNLLCFSNLTDNFCVQPPTPTAVKFHHNMFVRLNNLIDGATRPDNAEPLEAQHITNARRAFKVYPVRYYDVRNHYCRRWIELYLQGLGNIAQLTENVRYNDYSPTTAIEMKKLFREAYRLMCIELFQVPRTEADNVFNNDAPFYLKPEQIQSYNTSFIPKQEWLSHPGIGLVRTDDQLRDISTPGIPVAPGVPENQPNVQQQQAEQNAQNGIVVQ